MKKNRCLKIALGLLLLVLVTTCAIGTTLAKYTTGGNAQDSARVAKWGVKLEIEGDSMFSSEYKKDDGTITVKSTSVEEGNSGRIVAPGTASNSDTAACFSISGTPEVAVKIEVKLTVNNEIFLKKGEYTDPTVAGETFDLEEDYYPVVFTLTQVAGATDESDIIIKGNLAAIQGFLDDYSGETYKPNTKLDATFELSWEWAFNGNDKADTYLGNLIAGEKPDDLAFGEVYYSTKISYELEITVTQVD